MTKTCHPEPRNPEINSGQALSGVNSARKGGDTICIFLMKYFARGDGNKYKDISRAFFWTSTVWMGKFLYITFTSKNSGKVAYPGTFKFGFAIRCIKK